MVGLESHKPGRTVEAPALCGYLHEEPAPVRQKFLTPGAWALLVVMGLGVLAGLYRFTFGLQASTNLNQTYPWGLWIIADVAFIALAAGGFTTALIAHVLHREQFHSLARPALVVAMLGYTLAACALMADLGKYYNIWHPILPWCWQGNSALFEVGMCVMLYVTVLYLEFIPVFCERFIGDPHFPRLGRLCAFVNRASSKVMFLVVLLGVGISFLHQSSLGHVMVLAPTKLHPLWYSPIISLLFLISAIAVGFPTVIFACLYAAWAFKLKPHMEALSSLAKFTPVLLAVYFAFKLGDMIMRGSYVYLAQANLQTAFFLIEMVVGVLLPLFMLASVRVRRAPKLLALACALAMFGVVLNRTNVYWIGYHPQRAATMYFPSWCEWLVALGATAALILVWRFIAIIFPVVSQPLMVGWTSRDSDTPSSQPAYETIRQNAAPSALEKA